MDTNMNVNGREAHEDEVRENAKRISEQILTLTRNGLFVSLRFLDVALCQFTNLSADQVVGTPFRIDKIATTGEHLIYNTKYIIEQYMKDKQALSRDYLHIVIHCVFRHPFVSENLNVEYWNLAADIAAETVICDLEVKQAKTRNAAEINAEIDKIRQKAGRMNAESLYRFLQGDGVSQKEIDRWKQLFKRDEHDIWWEIARQIAEERKRRAEEEERKKRQAEEERRDEPEDEETGEESEAEGAEGEGGADESGDDEEGSDEGGPEAEGEESEEAGEAGEENGGGDSEESDESGEDEENEDGTRELDFEDEYTSTPNEDSGRENSDGAADPDSDTQDSGEASDGTGEGGGNPGDSPEQTDEKGADRKNNEDASGLEGKDDHDKNRKDDEQPEGEIGGSAGSGRPDEKPNADLFDNDEESRGGEKQQPGTGSSERSNAARGGEHTAGDGSAGSGTQSAWQHSTGGATQRSGGEKDENDMNRLSGEVSAEDEQESFRDDRIEAEAERGTAPADSDEKQRSPKYMHSGEEREELEEKWKDISERLMVDLETSSKEWGDKSDAMLQGLKKINRDRYDYTTFLRKFASMREDIQINDDEFDYVYYTLGLQRYGNIPLVEPLEYKEVKKVRDFVIAIDTSGSCAGEVVQKFLDKTYSIFSQQENFFRKINLHIIQCDAEIQSDVKITKKEEFDDYMKELEFKGFGGTDFRPVFQYVNTMVENGEFDDLKGLIYFTDGNGTYPKHRPDYETAFVFVDDDEYDYTVPSWAMKLVLDTDEIMEEVLV